MMGMLRIANDECPFLLVYVFDCLLFLDQYMVASVAGSTNYL